MLVSVRVKEEASKFCVLLIGQVYLPLIFGRGNPPYRKYLWDWFLHQHKRHGSWFWTFWEGTFLVVKSNLYFLDEGTTYWPTMRHLFEGHLWEPMLHPCMVHLDTYIYHKDQPNLGKYTIHGCYGEFKAASFHIMFVAQKNRLCKNLILTSAVSRKQRWQRPHGHHPHFAGCTPHALLESNVRRYHQR